MRSDKAALRRQMLKLRNAMPEPDRIELSKRIEEQILLKFSHIERFYLYSAIGSEVALSSLIDRLIGIGKEVFLPKVMGDDIQFGRVLSRGELVLGAFGVLEPAESEPAQLLDMKKSIILVPGVAFDLRGYRLGYGKGFYDRFLQSCIQNGYSELAKVGVCYKLQMVEYIPNDNFDVAMDMIATENGIEAAFA